MSVRVVFDNHRPLYTNLDIIKGRAILSITKNETISEINVKLEGVCKTRLTNELEAPSTFGGRGRRPGGPDVIDETEVHKILYKAIKVFPTQAVSHASPTSVYTLPPGLHEFPFEFKLPFNNACADARFTYVTVAGLQVKSAGNTDRHVKKTLPPSLAVFNDQALIRYFVKATVQRPAFYKENFRTEATFQFFPIEPPWPPTGARSEVFSRVQHAFAPTTSTASPRTAKSPGLFRKPVASKVDDSTTLPSPPQICIDCRLPNPAIIRCNLPLPLRILVTKLNESPATLFLQILQIELVAKTNVRAHHLTRDNLTTTIIVSKSNIRARLTEVDRFMQIDNGFWRDIPLPNSVAPSFDTCNISRAYDLHIKVGLSYGAGDQVLPELSIQTVIMPVQVYSGIAPPEALVQAMASQVPPRQPPRPHTFPTASGLLPHSPASASSTGLQQPGRQPHQTGQTHPVDPFPDDVPPSYEDAVADGIGPVDGPRGVYQQQQDDVGAWSGAQGAAGGKN
ncbi:MAG: hypothetical protein LQ346_000161 [Caloplaca aetnensis]|nr:MAG: hypothetical protein LQ346_000161 [Caloplaca aetnensis]